MAKPKLSRVSSFLAWVRDLLHGKSSGTKTYCYRPSLRLELLEDRLAPASLTDHLGALTIILDNPGEGLTIAATSANHYSLTSTTHDLFNAGLTGATYTGSSTSGTLNVLSDTSLHIIDTTTGASVTFANSSTFSYGQPVTVNLTNPLSGNVSFLGTSTFAAGLAVTTNGAISEGSSAVLTVSGNLSLSTNNSITLAGVVTSPNTTILKANGTITATANNNTGNNSFGILTLAGNSASLSPAASATINAGSGAVQLGLVDVSGNLAVTAGGNITQDFNGLTVGGTANFASTGGAITLGDNSGLGDGNNTIGGDISASVSVTGSNNITLDITPSPSAILPTITLGSITLGTGSLTLNDDGVSGTSLITEDPAANGIISGGAVNVNISSDFNVNVRLDTAANNLSGGAGSVTLASSSFFGSTSGDLGFRNTNAAAAVSQLAFTNFTISNVTLVFDNAAVNVDAAALSALPLATPNTLTNVTLTTGGNITQSAAITVTGNAGFTSTGGSITLGNTANSFAGDLSASVTGTNTVQLDNANATTTLGKISLGTGALTLNADDATGVSTITEDPAFANGGISTGGAVAINITTTDATANVLLNRAANNISGGAGSVTITGTSAAGGSSGDFGFRNVNAAAAIGELAFTNFTIHGLTVVFDNAAINLDVAALAALPLATPGTFTNLAVTAGGNLTQSAAITDTGSASFTVLGNSSSITLSNAANVVGGALSFNTPAADTGNVVFVNSGNVILGSSTLGKGTFSITAGGSGNFTENFGATITQVPGAGAATFTAGGTSIDLSGGSQNFFTGPLSFSGAAVTTVKLEDANPSATLATPGLGGVLSTLTSLSLIYDGPVSSILLPAVTNIGYSLSLTVTNNIVLPAVATLTVTGANLLTLDSLHGRINLLGQVVNAGGTTILRDEGTSFSGNSISAVNAGNSFGILDIISSAATNTIVAAGALTLGDSALTGFGTLSVSAASITQAGGTALMLSAFESANFTAISGGITLGNASNSLASPIAATVTGANNIVLANSNSSTQLSTITLGTGSLTINDDANSGSSSISEVFGKGITTAGPILITIAHDASANIDLSGAANNISGGAGSVAITGIAGGTTGNFGFRNTNPAAAMSQLAFTHFTINNLTVQLDNSSLDVGTLPAFSSSGNLSVTVGGNISQTAPIVTSGNATFAVQGLSADGSIVLNNAGNQLSGLVSFADSNSDNKQQISLTNNGSISLGASSLGLASFTLTAANAGNITSSAPVVQAIGGGPVTLNAAGTTISLYPMTGNDFTGPVSFHGSGVNNLTTIAFENDDPLATLPTLSGLAATLSSVSYHLANAPVLLLTIPSTITLNVTTGGNISQAPSTTLTVTGTATFNAGTYSIQLTNAGNNIAEVSLNNSGQNAVALTTAGPLVLDDSLLGDGSLTISAGGPITQTGGVLGIQQILGTNDAIAGVVSFSAGANPVLLDNPSNLFVGPLSVTATGSSGNVTILNSNALLLGNFSSPVGGGLSVTTLAGGITQAPGTSFNVQGNAYFAAPAGAISLTDAGNSIGGLIGLNASSVSVQVTGAAQLQASAATGGPFNLTAGGAITQPVGLLDIQGGNFISSSGGINLSKVNAHGQPVTLNAGAGAVNFTDGNSTGLTLGSVTFGGSFTLTAAGPITQQAGSALTGSGPVSISNSNNNPANAFAVSLNQSGNALGGTGSITLANVSNLTLANQGNLTLAGAFGLTTVADSGDVHLTAGGQVSLPAGTLSYGSLTVSAHQTNVAANLTATDAAGLTFIGAVNFSTPATLDVSAGGQVNFNGNVTTSQPLTFILPNHGNLNFNTGMWNQGANPLTIEGTQATFNINSQATFVMTGGTLNMTGTAPAVGAPSAPNRINVLGTFQVGGNVAISDGGTDSILDLKILGTLLVQLGSTPAKLTMNGLNPSDQIEAFGQLSGYGGTAPAGSTTVLSVANGGSILGAFFNLQDAGGNFLMGTDIVKPTYTDNTLSIVPTAAGPATVTGNLANGDKYTVAVTGGSNMVVIAPFGSALDIVVRTTTAATTLNITPTANGGNGYLDVGGIAINGAQAVTITAASVNLNGNIAIAGPLTSLSLHDWNQGTLTAGGTSAQASTITGKVFRDDTITLGTQLSALTVAEFTGTTPGSSITAASFGTITASGNLLNNTPGNFNVNLTNTNLAAAPALKSAAISGMLSGNWELAGAVGSATTGITATTTSNFNLGLPSGANVVNGGLLTTVGPLSLGTATAFNLNASGNVTSLTAVSLNDSSGLLLANSFGSITTTGSTALISPATHDHGNLVANITATGNAGGTTFLALGSLNIAGNLGQIGSPFTLLFNNGNVGAISVGGLVGDDGLIQALSTVNGGAITSIKAASWQGANLNAKSVGTWTVASNLPAQLFGNFIAAVTLTGVAGSSTATLGTFSTTNDLSATFTILNGGVTSFTVGGSMLNSDLLLQSSVTGLGTISAAEWSNDTVIARTIGTVKATGRAAATAATPPLNGDIFASNITAFEPINLGTPGIGTLSVAGSLSHGRSGNSVILANNGITTFSIGRDVTNVQIATDLNGGSGGITTLTAGQWINADLAAFFLGSVSITSFLTPEQTTGFLPADFQNSDVILNGNNAVSKQGINTLTVANNLSNDFFNVPFGIGTVTVTGSASNTTLIDLRNAATATSGVLGAFSAGAANQLTLYANSVLTAVKTVGNPSLGLNGDFSQSTLAVTGFSGPTTAPVGVTTLSVAGNLDQSTVNVKDGITTFSVTQNVTSSTIGAAYDALNTSASLKTLTAASWANTNLAADSIGTFSIMGNANYFIAGDLTQSRITLLRALTGVALGAFTATGHVDHAYFQVTSGNVTSFTTAYFVNSSLLVGYVPVDRTNLFGNAANNQQAANWQGTFTLGTFKTTALLNLADVADTAGFQNSDVVAGKLGIVALGGINSSPLPGTGVTTFGIFFRHTGAPATTFTINGVSQANPTATGSFNYFGLAG